jgi:hypothetical protein
MSRVASYENEWDFFSIPIAIYGVCFLNGIFNENAIRRNTYRVCGGANWVELNLNLF